MVGSKNTPTGIKMHPYILFSSNNVSMKSHVGMHLVCYYPYYFCVLFDPTIPTYANFS